LYKHPRADQECGFVARLTTSKDGRSAYDKSDCINPACARCVSMFRGMMLTGGEARHKGGGFKVVALSGALTFREGGRSVSTKNLNLISDWRASFISDQLYLGRGSLFIINNWKASVRLLSPFHTISFSQLDPYENCRSRIKHIEGKFILAMCVKISIFSARIRPVRSLRVEIASRVY